MQAGQGQFDRTQQSARGRWRSSARVCSVRLGEWLVVLNLCTILCSGCSRLQLPAIDPNGSRIFLPLPNTTQLAVPRLHSRDGEPGIIPNPAFAAPAVPPPCLDGAPPADRHALLKHHKLASKVKQHFSSPGKAGEIQLTPLRVVAPVGGEVVLLAGICGPNGYFVKRQPLEWMLSPDSVGTFIEVGDDSPGKLISALTLHSGPRAEKLDVDFAKGRTSSSEAMITRGSPDRNDDIPLKEGQTWLSISSPSEGVSRVTVLAPDSEIWDRRRQTATIYWIDAQWEFPQPQPARSEETIQFITRVTKSENLVPAENWIVRYTIIDPSVASFVPPASVNGVQINGNVATVRVNRDSQAIVQVAAALDAQGQRARGTTPILIDVIRPADPSDNMPELKIASGQTFATFSSPGLNLQSFGPDVASVGEQVTYVASLGNPGDVDAENTQLVMALPVGTRLVAATPQPSSETNAALAWDQGVLAAHRQLDVSVVLETLRPGTFDVRFQAVATGNLKAESSTRTEVVESSVDLSFVPSDGAAQAEVGQRLQYDIDITNSSRQTLTDLRVVIESDPGLPEENQGANKVEQNISFIQPGQTFPLAVGFIVRQEGQLAANVRVYSGQNLLAERSTSILGLAPRPKRPDIGLSIEFPEQLQVGRTYDAYITIRNPGEVKLTGLNVELQWGASLIATAVDPSNASRFRLGADRQSAVWSTQDLLPPLPQDGGDMIRQLHLQFQCVASAPQAALSARVAANEGVQASDSRTYRAIMSPGQTPGPVTPPVLPPTNPSVDPPGGTVNPPVLPPAETRQGNWEIVLADYGDPTTVGLPVRYTVNITNKQNLIDRNVRIQLRLPPGVNFENAINIDGRPVRYEFGEGNTVSFEPINSVRPGESITYIVRVVPTVPGVMLLRARVLSTEKPEPVETQESTTVNPRN